MSSVSTRNPRWRSWQTKGAEFRFVSSRSCSYYSDLGVDALDIDSNLNSHAFSWKLLWAPFCKRVPQAIACHQPHPGLLQVSRCPLISTLRCSSSKKTLFFAQIRLTILYRSTRSLQVVLNGSVKASRSWSRAYLWIRIQSHHSVAPLSG